MRQVEPVLAVGLAEQHPREVRVLELEPLFGQFDRRRSVARRPVQPSQRLAGGDEKEGGQGLVPAIQRDQLSLQRTAVVTRLQVLL